VDQQERTRKKGRATNYRSEGYTIGQWSHTNTLKLEGIEEHIRKMDYKMVDGRNDKLTYIISPIEHRSSLQNKWESYLNKYNEL